MVEQCRKYGAARTRETSKEVECLHESPLPDMIHSVLVILIHVATPFASSVREPVAPSPARRIVSDVMAIVTTPAPFWLMNVIAVPMGKATLLFGGIVNVRAAVSAEG